MVEALQQNNVVHSEWGGERGGGERIRNERGREGKRGCRRREKEEWKSGSGRRRVSADRRRVSTVNNHFSSGYL